MVANQPIDIINYKVYRGRVYQLQLVLLIHVPNLPRAAPSAAASSRRGAGNRDAQTLAIKRRRRQRCLWVLAGTSVANVSGDVHEVTCTLGSTVSADLMLPHAQGAARGAGRYSGPVTPTRFGEVHPSTISATRSSPLRSARNCASAVLALATSRREAADLLVLLVRSVTLLVARLQAVPTLAAGRQPCEHLLHRQLPAQQLRGVEQLMRRHRQLTRAVRRPPHGSLHRNPQPAERHRAGSSPCRHAARSLPCLRSPGQGAHVSVHHRDHHPASPDRSAMPAGPHACPRRPQLSPRSRARARSASPPLCRSCCSW